MKQKLSDTDADISCIYDEFSILAICQEKNGDLTIETMEWNENVRPFFYAFTVFNPAGSEQHLELFYFFLRLLQKEYAPECSIDLPPNIRDCAIKTLESERGNTLSFYFAKESHLIGLQSCRQPPVWLLPPNDEITQNMKKTVLSL